MNLYYVPCITSFNACWYVTTIATRTSELLLNLFSICFIEY